MRQYRRRKIRLPLDRYGEPGSIWHVTMTTLGRQRVLADQDFALDVIESLKFTCAKAKATLLVYCAMPDHLHALILIEERDLTSIVHDVKSYTTRLWWKRGGSEKIWQRSAYDRGIRSSEHLDDLIRYVFDNPAELDEIEGWLESGLLGGSLIADGT